MTDFRPDIVNVKALGADGIGGNADEYFLGAQLAAKGRATTLFGDTRLRGRTTIDIPAGDYTLTEINAMLGRESTTTQTNGLRIRGAGSGLVNVIFSPTVEGALLFNSSWQNIAIEGITFITTFAGATFMQSYTSNAAQAYTFIDCSWTGPWKYIFDLQGTTNNSEFRFLSCGTSGMQDGGCFLYIGDNGSDQFLNYWFFGFKHWSTSASIVDAARGGHFHFYGTDVSKWGNSLTSINHLFKLRGSNHARGGQSLTLTDFRLEAQSNFAALLYCEWEMGNIAFRNFDMSSHMSFQVYEEIMTIVYNNVDGPIYTFSDCWLAGTVRVRFGSNSYLGQKKILFRDTTWHMKDSPSDVVVYEPIAGHTNLTYPPVEFVHCRGAQRSITAATGAGVWDAVVGFNGTNLQSLEKRELSVRGTTGSIPFGTSVLTVILPANALITEVEVMSPAGATAEADGGTWTLATTDATPATIATVTVPGALSAGFRQTTALAVPFRCDTPTRRTVTVSATNVSTANSQGVVLIKGYW